MSPENVQLNKSNQMNRSIIHAHRGRGADVTFSYRCSWKFNLKTLLILSTSNSWFTLARRVNKARDFNSKVFSVSKLTHKLELHLNWPVKPFINYRIRIIISLAPKHGVNIKSTRLSSGQRLDWIINVIYLSFEVHFTTRTRNTWFNYRAVKVFKIHSLNLNATRKT